MKKTHRCTLDIPDMKKTESGKTKIWKTDNIRTFCCEIHPSLFIWEKATKHNNYDPYYGYVYEKHVILI